MCSTAPRCSTSSPTSLLFVFSSAVRFATSERQNSGTPGMARPPRLRTHTGRKHTRVMVRELRNIVKTQESRLSHPLHTGHTGVTPSPNRRVCLVSAETQIQLLLLCQLAVVHVDHQILNKNRLDLAYLQNTMGTCKKTFVQFNEDI